MRNFLLLFFILSIGFFAFGDNHYGFGSEEYHETVDAGFDMLIEMPDQILKGDEFKYKILITWNDEISNVEVKKRPRDGGAEILNWEQKLWIDQDGNKRLEIIATVKAQEAGSVYFVPFDLTYMRGEHKDRTIIKPEWFSIKEAIDVIKSIDIKQTTVGLPVTYNLTLKVRKGSVNLKWGTINGEQLGFPGEPEYIKEIQDDYTEYKISQQLFLPFAGKFELIPIIIDHHIDGAMNIIEPLPETVNIVPIETRLYFDKRVMQIGDIFTFIYKFNILDENIKIISRNQDFDYSPFEVIEREIKDGIMKLSLRLFAQPGDYELGPFTFNYENIKTGKADKFIMPAMTIRLNGLVPKEGASLKGFTPPITSKPNFLINLYNLYIPFTMVGIIVLYFVWIFTPKIIAMLKRGEKYTELDVLRSSLKGHINKFLENHNEDSLFDICLFVKVIVGKKNGWSHEKIMASTTDELLELVKGEKLKNAVGIILKECDRIRYDTDTEIKNIEIVPALAIIKKQMLGETK